MKKPVVYLLLFAGILFFLNYGISISKVNTLATPIPPSWKRTTTVTPLPTAITPSPTPTPYPAEIVTFKPGDEKTITNGNSYIAIQYGGSGYWGNLWSCNTNPVSDCDSHDSEAGIWQFFDNKVNVASSSIGGNLQIYKGWRVVTP